MIIIVKLLEILQSNMIITRYNIFAILVTCYDVATDRSEAPLNIIVFMVDDLGWNDVGFHGSNQIPTPNIDALAYNGIILNRHYVLPSCSSTRAAFLSGKYPIRMAMQGDGIRGGEPRGLPLNVQILPEYLHGLGYVTRLVGKWHIGYHTPQHTPLHRGFDSFIGIYNSHVSYYDYKYSQGNMSGYDMHRGTDPAYGLEGKYITDLFTAEALKIIDHHDKRWPLYLQISHLAVHAPLEIPLDYISDKEFAYIREPNRRKYAIMVSRLDESIGRIISSLGDTGMLEDSLVLFVTDNGAAPIGKFRNWGSNWPLRGTKYTLYEGGVRGNALIWSPRLDKMGRVSNQLIHITDWLPTLYAAAGGNPLDLGDIDGINQWNVLNDGSGNAREEILLNIDEYTKTEAAIRGRFKLLRGSINTGYYDGVEGESGRNRELPVYNNSKILHSAVSGAIHKIGRPITQSTAMHNLKKEATVQCRPHWIFGERHNFATCNETECLFDIVNDPCETVNIAKHYPRIVTELDLFLEKWGNVLWKQGRLPIDWMADPRRHNNTWEPWLNSGPFVYTYTSESFILHQNRILILFIIAYQICKNI